MTTEPILFLHASDRGQQWVNRWRGERPLFVCVLAHTDTCLLPGVSAAGATEELRPYTPAADAEAVLYGLPRCVPGLPSNPLGPPGPAAITRAAVQLANLPVRFIAAGLRVWPDVPFDRVDCQPGGRIDRGDAVPAAPRLFEEGVVMGRALADRTPYVVLGESVPGGTTTALALLIALGIRAEGRVSGSMPGNAHALKTRVATAALRASHLRPGDGLGDPLHAAGQVGDPMQPLAAGIAHGALLAGAHVMLAGGSQMLAVAALLRALEGDAVFEHLVLGTTRWVACDPDADVPGLAAEVSPRLPLLAINLNFAQSRHLGLRPYETFLVKEGVGAGGACIAALLATGVTLDRLHGAIDDAYDPVLAPISALRTEGALFAGPPPLSRDTRGTPCPGQRLESPQNKRECQWPYDPSL